MPDERIEKENVENILLDHGSGGKISHSMFSQMILPLFNHAELARHTVEITGNR